MITKKTFSGEQSSVAIAQKHTKKNVSIYDIADRLKISPSTVSRALNGHKTIGAEVSREVINVSREMRFVPRKKFRTVALVIGEMSRFEPVGYSGILSVLLAKQFKARGLVLELIDVNDLDYLRILSFDAVVGIVFEDSMTKIQDIPNLPVLTINCPMREYGFHSISINHRQGARLATECLLKNGHRNIAFIEDRESNWGSVERFCGYRDALNDAAVDLDQNMVFYATKTRLFEIVDKIFRFGGTGIVNCSEDIALELPHYLQNILKKNIPDDISLITIETNPVQKYMTPPQTVIHQPFEEMCALIAEKIQEMIVHRTDKVFDIVLESSLIEYDSVKKINSI
ncbi:MAG: LacI family DNA-binding transcriptional regulator [Lentisphaerota bacterium]